MHPHFFARLHQLHLALLAGGDVRDNVASAVLMPLTEYLHARRRSSDDQVVGTATSDAILEYLNCPVKAKASSGQQVWAHLCRAAWCNVGNAEAKERRRVKAEARFGLAEEIREHDRAKRIVELLHAKGDRRSDANELDRTRHAVLHAVLGLTLNDQRIWQMMQDGIRRTGEYAIVLGIAHLPAREQRQLVRRTKERVRQQMKRSQG